MEQSKQFGLISVLCSNASFIISYEAKPLAPSFNTTQPYDSVDLPEILVQFTGIQTLDVNIDSDPLIKAVAIGAVAFLTVWNCFGKFIEVCLESWT